MQYQNTIIGTFIDRPNRFIAHVEVEGIRETVHVKNTGRCKELLLPGCQVVLEVCDNPSRKTKYDLIAVYKEAVEAGGFSGWINIDSQAPNKVAYEWFRTKDYTYIKPEYVYGNSRIDFYMEKGEEKYLVEVKGCTLEMDGIGYFPDAPTERGVKHLKELTGAVSGHHCAIAFVIQMEGIKEVRPFRQMHPEFADALEEAKAAGVEVWFLLCQVKTDQLYVVDEIINGK